MMTISPNNLHFYIKAASEFFKHLRRKLAFLTFIFKPTYLLSPYGTELFLSQDLSPFEQ